MRLRLFVDANVIVSAVLTGGPARSLLFAAEQDRLETITSGYVLAEVENAIVTKLRRPAEVLSGALARMRLVVCKEASDRAVAQAHQLVRDPKDAAVLAAAWGASVDALVTGDKDLLEATADLRIRVLRTTEALALLSDRALREG